MFFFVFIRFLIRLEILKQTFVDECYLDIVRKMNEISTFLNFKHKRSNILNFKLQSNLLLSSFSLLKNNEKRKKFGMSNLYESDYIITVNLPSLIVLEIYRFNLLTNLRASAY